MAKTIPQIAKIDRGDDEHVAPDYVEPYAWQRALKPAPKATTPIRDPFKPRTAPAPRPTGAAPEAAPDRTVPDARRRGR